MTKPRYARFYKCDLQMQTPIDRKHWVGEALPQSASDADLQQAAKEYIERCYDVGLEAIAITDHNLGGSQNQDFFGHLRAQASSQGADHGYAITIFPGFEIEVKTPGRCHLLCLFSPDTEFSVVDHKLSELGLPLDKRFKSQKPQPADKDLDEVLALVKPPNGIVIAAHADRKKGVLDDIQMAECWHQDAIRNDDLLCIELHKHREYYQEGKLGMIVRNDPGDWQRSHQIAVVNSSDCKRLRESDGSGDESWIGKRFTWIKMGEPSIEGLRQAFLDHESRIRFGDVRPEDLQTYPRIERIKVHGTKFLADQEIQLSSNLTTFIGGGGTGKSTIIEYLRAALGHPPSASQDVLANHEKAVQSLGTGQIEFTLRQGGETIDVTYRAIQSTAKVGGSEVEDLPARFPVLVLSQREIFAIAGSGDETLRVLDQLQRDRIEELRRKASSLRATLTALGSELDKLPSLEGQRKEVAEEIARRASELALIESQQAPLARRNLLRREQRAVGSVDAALDRVAAATEEFADGVSLGVGKSGYRSPDVPHADAIDSLVGRAQAHVSQLADQIREAAAELRRRMAMEQEAEERQTWAAALDLAESEYANLLAEPGSEPEIGAEVLRAEIENRRAELEVLDEQIASLHAKAELRPEVLDQLRAVWRQELDARREIAEQSAELVPKTKDGSPFISVTIDPFADADALWAELNASVDHRSVSEEELESLCAKLGEAAAGGNPLDIFVAGLEKADDGDPPPWFGDLRPSVQKALSKQFPQARRRSLQLVRIEDRAVVTLRRMDGSVAGTLDSGLSVGQKCTAILALVLSAGAQQPIIIDQPEDEIDNEFIYRELVPLLRKAKQRRQVIIATHNPNLPVNGDAELIYPLEARSGGTGGGSSAHGAPWKAKDGAEAVGSLDRKIVKEAVEEIMEGSEEAFQRRLARYGF